MSPIFNRPDSHQVTSIHFVKNKMDKILQHSLDLNPSQKNFLRFLFLC